MLKVGVEDAHHASPSGGDAIDDRGGQAPTPPAVEHVDPGGEPRQIGQDLLGAIHAVVDDNEFIVGSRERGVDALDEPVDILGLVVGGDDDGQRCHPMPSARWCPPVVRRDIARACRGRVRGKSSSRRSQTRGAPWARWWPS